MSCDQDLDKLSEKLNSRLLEQEEHGFHKGGHNVPPWPQDKKKPGLDRVKHHSHSASAGAESDSNPTQVV